MKRSKYLMDENVRFIVFHRHLLDRLVRSKHPETFYLFARWQKRKGRKFMPHCRKQETVDLPPSPRLHFLRTVAYFKRGAIYAPFICPGIGRESERNLGTTGRAG